MGKRTKSKVAQGVPRRGIKLHDKIPEFRPGEVRVVSPPPSQPFCPHRAVCFIIWGALVALIAIWGGCYLVHTSPSWLHLPLIMTSAAMTLGGLIILVHGILEKSVK